MNLNKRNVVLQAAVASAFMLAAAGAQAALTGPATPAKFASELFGTSSSSTAIVNAGNAMTVVYTLGVARPTSSGAFQVIYTLGGSAQLDVAAVAANVALAGGTCAGTVAVRSGGGVGSTTVTFDVSPTGDCAVGNTITFSTPNLKNAQSLATVGAFIPMTIELKDLFGTFDTSGAHSTNIATSSQSVTATATAAVAGAAPKLDTIDAISQSAKFFLNGSTTGIKVTTLGTMAYAAVANVKQKDGATDRATLAGDAIAMTITGDFSASSPVGVSGVRLEAAAACDKSGVTINATSLTTTTATFSSVAGNTTATNICVTIDGTTPAVPSTYKLTATYTPAITSEAVTTTSNASLMTTKLNVTQVDVRNYVPKAVTGWVNYFRIINSGTPAAKISVQLIDPSTGSAVGTPGTLITSLAAGAAQTVDSTAIEAALGLNSGLGTNDRPRIRVTGATSALEVQNFLFTPNGAFSITHGKE